jgi:inorganic triphosphatase YgiF
MASEHLEIERKYDVGEDVPWVDLRSLPSVHQLAPPRQDDLRAEYFDTDQLNLARAGITLRRRTGGPDAGWHLKLPGQGWRSDGARRTTG